MDGPSLAGRSQGRVRPSCRDDLHPLHSTDWAGRRPGAWRTYYQRWRSFTLDEIDPELLELVEPLKGLTPLADVLDKPAYSPFHATDLHDRLQGRGVNTLVITGAETDVCVLAAAVSAMDHGYSVVLPKDALCSSADETHDALMTLYARRFAQQVFLTESRDLLDAWPAAS